MYRQPPALARDPQARGVARALYLVAAVTLATFALPFALDWALGAASAPVGYDFRPLLRAAVAARVGGFVAKAVLVAALAWIARAELSRPVRPAVHLALVVTVLQECSALVAIVPLMRGPEVLVPRPLGCLLTEPLVPALNLAVPIALAVAAARLAHDAPRAIRAGAAALCAASVFAHLGVTRTFTGRVVLDGPAGLGTSPLWPYVALAAPLLLAALLVAAAVSVGRAPPLPVPPPPPRAVAKTRRAVRRMGLAVALHAVATATAVGGVAQLVFARDFPLGPAARFQLTLIPVLQIAACVVMIVATTTMAAHAPARVAAAARRARAFAVVGMLAASVLVGVLWTSLQSGSGNSTADLATVLYGLFELAPLAASWSLARAVRAATDGTEHAWLSARIALGLLGEAVATVAVLGFAYLSLHSTQQEVPARALVDVATTTAVTAGLAGAVAMMGVIARAADAAEPGARAPREVEEPAVAVG
jgi:hypothetical protein